MAQSQFATALIDETINTFNGSVTMISPMDGIVLIDNWISALRSGDASTNPVASTLSELKLELQSGNPKADRIEDMLDQLVGETRGFADSAEASEQASLNMLAAALDTFRKQLAGESGPANTGGRATAGATVSGMSTTSVRQPTANDAGNDQDQANDTTYIDSSRSSTVDPQTNTSSAPGGNSGDQTADADGNTQGGGSYGSGYGTGSTQEEGTENSGTETDESSVTAPGQSGGRIGGHGISGGQSEEETGSSSGNTGV